MGLLIKRFENGSYLEYDKGSFDDWCVYFTSPSGSRVPPRDVDYFAELKALASAYGSGRVYRDFVSIYEMTGKAVQPKVLEQISRIAGGYDDALAVDITFSILYLAMIAEEHRAHTHLGKRIKRLGVHMLLFENVDIYSAANSTRGMKWQNIARLCAERGF